MTQEALNYASDLRKTDIPKEMLTQVKEILEAVPQVRVDFENPAVAVEKKHLVIERVFPKEIRNFMKILCDNNDFALFDEIVTAYDELDKEPESGENKAELTYVTAPDEEQLAGIRKFLNKEFGSEDMEIEMKEDKYSDINWHMIGHLQRNKVKYIADKVCLIFPYFTSNKIVSAPLASFLDIIDEAINGIQETVPVTSRKA